jgi:hypothetical protein
MSNTLWSAPVQSVLGCKIPHELDALKRKATGGGRGRRRRIIIISRRHKIIVYEAFY